MSEASIERDAPAADVQEAPATSARYTRVAILLHWVIAAAILFQIWSGWTAYEAFQAGGDDAESAAILLQTHKSIGVAVLILSLLRLAWRLVNPAPPLPASLPGWQRAASAASHWLLYAGMIGAPLLGWIYASTSDIVVEAGWVRLYEVPLLPILPELEDEMRTQIAGLARDLHAVAAYGMALLLIAHVAAALKHHFIDRDAVLARMTPGLRPLTGFLSGPIRAVISLVRRLGALSLVAIAVIAVVAIVFAVNRAQDIQGDGPSFEADLSNVGAVGGAGDAPAAEDAAPDAPAATVARWTPIYDESEIVARTNADNRVADVTLAWTGEIFFDPDDLAGSSVVVEFDMTAARTAYGSAQSTMLQRAWLDAGGHPTATFTADRFERGAEEGAFIAFGELTLRGVTQAVELPFTLVIEGARAEMTAQTTIMRLDYGIGVGVDSANRPAAEVVVDITVVAERAE